MPTNIDKVDKKKTMVYIYKIRFIFLLVCNKTGSYAVCYNVDGSEGHHVALNEADKQIRDFPSMWDIKLHRTILITQWQ